MVSYLVYETFTVHAWASAPRKRKWGPEKNVQFIEKNTYADPDRLIDVSNMCALYRKKHFKHYTHINTINLQVPFIVTHHHAIQAFQPGNFPYGLVFCHLFWSANYSIPVINEILTGCWNIMKMKSVAWQYNWQISNGRACILVSYIYKWMSDYDILHTFTEMVTLYNHEIQDL